ncbi:MAG: efflux RND transporter periplasmic adaptor subunit [Myxococcales bacterium]
MNQPVLLSTPLLCLTCLLGLTFACRNESSATAASASPVASASSERIVSVDRSLLEQGRVSLSVTEKRPLYDELMVTGQVVAPPKGKAEIGALLTARIRGISVEEGQVVKKGEVLATLVAPDAAKISGELAAARARRTRAETVLAQEKKLAEQSATSERAVSDATSEAASARADEHAASVMLGTYDVNGAQLTLRSPLAGVVAASNALLGAQVDPDTILFRVVDPAQLVVRADVPESMANRVRSGASSEIRLPTQGVVCPATIVSSTRSVDPIKRTVSFRIKPLETCPAMLEGGFADVRIPLDVKRQGEETGTRQQGAIAGAPNAAQAADAVEKNLVTLPRSAVVEIDGVPIAFVATETEGRYRLAPLSVHKHTEVTTWVERGLVGGERVVSRGALLLKGEWLKSRLE